MKRIYIIAFLLPYLLLRHRKFLFKYGLSSFYLTVRFNFKQFEIKKAIVFPIYITSNYRLKSIEGKVVLNSEIAPGIIRFGTYEIGIFDRKTDIGIIDLKANSTLVFNGKALFGIACRISINENAELFIGNNFTITAATTIICSNNIFIGADCLFSWKILIMDTDLHTILPNNNINTGIKISDSVWVGCNTHILKNSSIATNSVVGAKSLVNKVFNDPNGLIAGNPAKKIKDDIRWR